MQISTECEKLPKSMLWFFSLANVNYTHTHHCRHTQWATFDCVVPWREWSNNTCRAWPRLRFNLCLEIISVPLDYELFCVHSATHIHTHTHTLTCRPNPLKTNWRLILCHATRCRKLGQLGPKLALALASTLALASSSNNIVSGVVVVVSYVPIVVVAVAFVVRRQQSESANSSRTCHTSKESAPHLRERHQPRVFHCQRVPMAGATG